MDVRSYEAGQESAGREVEVALACDKKRSIAWEVVRWK